MTSNNGQNSLGKHLSSRQPIRVRVEHRIGGGEYVLRLPLGEVVLYIQVWK